MYVLKQRIKVLSLLLMLVMPCGMLAQAVFTAGELKVTISGDGSVSSVYDVVRNREYLAAGQPSPLVQIRVDGRWEPPLRAVFRPRPGTAGSGVLVLNYAKSGVELQIRVHPDSTHIRFEITGAAPAGKAELVAWGPLPLSISETVGEIVGVARNRDFAIGLLGLNVKTLGGFPLNDEGSDPSRSNSAKKTTFGCVLQAFTMDRSQPRSISVWWDQYPEMPVPAVAGETVEGSAVALFGCDAGKALATIGLIEQAESLPHPLIDGVWSKISDQTGRSYLIADYSESTVDELLGYTKRANLMTLYHMNAWKSWGHYALDSLYFPHGTAGFKACLAKAKQMGIRLGAHTLTDFINTNDPYVTPVPDVRLAVTGTSRLTAGISDSATEIEVLSPVYFSNEKANWLHTVRIGSELVQYSAVTTDAPFLLTGCKRGAFGTKPAFHQKDAEVAKLLDHPYKVFFPNLDLMQEIAANLARRFNETGLEQMDFDGHEGCLSTGQGDYALELFAKTFYDNLDHTVLNGTSISEPFYWHINTYCNWGEPWNGGFTQSMQQYRLDNQGLLERNYLPNMLGWYLLTDSTTLPEMEWMLARSAGYNAGFAMATSLEALRKNPRTGDMLDAIREWETCRREHLFPEELREQLKDTKREFHLEKMSENEWTLFPLTFEETPGQGRAAITKGEPVRLVRPKQ